MPPALPLLLLVVAPQGVVEVEPNDPCVAATPVSVASTTTLSGTLTPGDVDHWELFLPPGPFSHEWYLLLEDVPGAEVELTLGVNCSFFVSQDAREGQILVTSANPAGHSLVLRVHGVGVTGSGAGYAVRVFEDPCTVFGPDRYEPNDTLATAAQLTPGVNGDAVMSAGEVDVYRYRVPAETTSRFLAQPSILAILGGLDIELIDAASGAVLATTSTFFLELPPAPVERTVLARLTGGPGARCGPYHPRVELDVDPCHRALHDALEGPDVFGTAAPIPVGAYPSLTVTDTDPDAHAVVVPPGEAVLARLFVSGPLGGQILFTSEALPGVAAALVDQYVAWGAVPVRVLVNEGAQPAVAQLGVASLTPCAGYALELVPLGPVAGPFCAGFTSSGAPAARLEAYGAGLAVTGELALRASGFPPATAALGGTGTFLVGTAAAPGAGTVPGLCVGGATLRLGASVQVLAPRVGAAEWSFEFGLTPLGASAVSGQTFTAQLWYRSQLNPAEFGASDAVRFVVQ